MNAYKVYSSLELNEKMPMFPFTFTEAMAASWVPAIWYKVADHLVDRVMNHEKITKEDIEKSKFWIMISNTSTLTLLIVNVWFSQSFNTLLEGCGSA